ncbi:alpha/beta fold hydrolase [Kitasatospora sp. NPDC093806]|uniref:alpha/beta hydrolase family protein n=1 Tax=Kitasatospora sp. NPDC093806 TaxID=3155075 RepID=UPI0034428D19
MSTGRREDPAVERLAIPVPGLPATLAATVTVPERTAPDAVAVLWPALGVKADHYRAFAAELARTGFAVVAVDLRGQGASRPRPGRATRHGYHELATVDWPAVLRAVRDRFGTLPVHSVGHSLGGQLSLLHAAAHPGAVDGVVLVAAGSVDHRGFPGLHGPRVLAATHLTAAVAGAVGYWPGDRLGFAGRQSAVLLRDWARICRTGRFEPAGADRDYEALLAGATVPVLAVSMAGDRLAPVPAVDRLCAKVPAAPVTRHHHGADAARPPDHFRWVRDSGAIADRIRAWADALR